MSAAADGMPEATERRLRRIWDRVREIPPGSVANYGQIAELAGIPRGARQVGYALRQLPHGTDVPWHRVVNASGGISLPADSAGFKEQKRRLAEEGVVVIAGKVRLREFRWEPDMDELLWKPAGL